MRADELINMLERNLHRVGTARTRHLGHRSPEPVELLLEDLKPVADIDGILGLAFGVDEDGQVAAYADGVHIVEEEEPVPAEKILDIVLRRDEQDVDAPLIEKPVQAGRVEGQF